MVLNGVVLQDSVRKAIVSTLSHSLADAQRNPGLTRLGLGLAVAKIREELGLSHKELARRAQIERSKIAKAEHAGLRPDCDNEAIVFAKIARGFGLNEAEISSLVKLYIGINTHNHDLGIEIRRARIVAGFSVGDLAHLTGMRREDLKAIESGELPIDHNISDEGIRIGKNNAISLQEFLNLGDIHLEELLRPHTY